ncbi:MAG: hypothetical protein P1V35_12555, partial [Planctomycetota bacterium]|nr:hypothetical protein [Planctomycetota bacterium]
TGLMGPESEEFSAIHHAMASLAMADNYYDSRNPFQKMQTHRALRYIDRTQNFDGGWHQEVPCRESSDVLLASWNLLARSAGIEARLRMDPTSFDKGVDWLQANTDPATGRIGPDPIADMRSLNDKDLRSNARVSTALTRAGWFAQVTADRPLKRPDLMQIQANNACEDLPTWRPDGLVDWQSWFFGTQLMFQVGGEPWERWNKALGTAVIPHQSMGENLRGSWPPGFAGGRIQSTAFALLALQIPHRHQRLLALHSKK